MEGIFISQHKYILGLLKERGMFGCKPVGTLVDVNVKLGKGEEDTPVNKEAF